MAEYIPREAAVEMVKRICNCALDARRTHLDVVDDGIETMRGIASIPAADVAPVVRCKGCKHRVYKYINEEIGEIGGCELFNRAMSNDDFCSYGEYQTNGGADHENQRN